jgi:hypothetical protein
MSADEFDVDRLEAVGDGDNQAVAVAFDIEDDAILTDEADAGVEILDVLRAPQDATLASSYQAFSGCSASA